jgi:hypothetical protein
MPIEELPGMGSFIPDPEDPDFNPERPDAIDHMKGWNQAVAAALENFGRAPGDYHAELTLSAKIHATNPGSAVEYIAKFT